MAAKAAYVVGQKRFVQTMRKAGADMKELKDVNRQAADIALPAVRQLAPRGESGRLAGSYSRWRDPEGRRHPCRPQVRALRGSHQLRVAEKGHQTPPVRQPGRGRHRGRVAARLQAVHR